MRKPKGIQERLKKYIRKKKEKRYKPCGSRCE
jgi:hypothetical protein